MENVDKQKTNNNKPQGLTLSHTDASSERLPITNKFALASPQQQTSAIKITNVQGGLSSKFTPKQVPKIQSELVDGEPHDSDQNLQLSEFELKMKAEQDSFVSN